MSFIEENCERCGTCLAECPYLTDLSTEQAKREITNLIETKILGESIKRCIGCAYCDAICPTKSNPRELIREASIERFKSQGLPCFYLPHEEIEINDATIALNLGDEGLKKKVHQYQHPPKSKQMFYLGCGLSYVQTDLINTKLLDEFPKIGGVKFCCGSYTKLFGLDEIEIKGRNLLEEFCAFGIEKFIIFCPGCLRMMYIYSNIIPEFEKSIKLQTFSAFLVEKYHKDELKIKNQIKERITFHDPCAWRNLDKKIFDAPRELLEILGAEVIEMKHNFNKTLCCGSSLANSDKDFFNFVSGMRISEVKEIEATSIAVSCTGCLALAKPAKENNIELYHILELVQRAIGEDPPHKIIETSEKYRELINQTIKNHPKVLKDKCIIKDGRIQYL
ncbi:MAG: (Fe-S)-binding protein [Candidatus Hodarchaeota archaeon]